MSTLNAQHREFNCRHASTKSVLKTSSHQLTVLPQNSMQLCFHVRMNIVTVAKSNIESALDLKKRYIFYIYTHILHLPSASRRTACTKEGSRLFFSDTSSGRYLSGCIFITADLFTGSAGETTGVLNVTMQL